MNPLTWRILSITPNPKLDSPQKRAFTLRYECVNPDGSTTPYRVYRLADDELEVVNFFNNFFNNWAANNKP